MLRALEQHIAIYGATVLSALVPAAKKQSRYVERRVPVQRAEATHLAELGGRILPRDLWDAVGGMRRDREMLE